MHRIRKFVLSENAATPVYGLGLLTDEPDYRLCWLLNQGFSWGLAKSEDISVTDKESPITQTYTCFERAGDKHPEIWLIGNRSKEGQWLTIFRQVDYLLILSPHDSPDFSIDDLRSAIATKVPQIRGLFKVPLPSFCYL